MTTPDLTRLNVVGPFWSAELDLVTLDAPQRNLALRRLFLDLTPREVAGNDKVLAPGTLLALCRPRRAQVTPAPGAQSTYKWQRPQNAPAPPLGTFDEVRAAVRSGAACLLLLEADPAKWSADDDDDPPTFTCLAGEISLDGLKPQKDDVRRLYTALALEEPDSASVRPPGRLTLHASGLSIFGSAALPWQSGRVTAPFLLARVLPPPDVAAPAFRLTIETERLAEGERDALIAAAQLLSGMLNPRYPLNQPPRPAAPAPRWATLELVNPAVPPRVVWPIPAWGTLGRLTFERGEVNLLLGDRPPYDADRPPDSLARVIPDSVTIAPDGGQLIVTVRAGAAPDFATDSPPDSLVYNYQSGRVEQITFHQITTCFSPTETPKLLRVAQGLPVPTWDDDDRAPLAEPLVWGFAPLDDGWAQLPIPNLTEQIYLDAGLAQLDDREADSPLVQGAVSFTNRRADGSLADAAEHPWSVTLTGTPGLAGTWTLADAGEDLALDAVKLIVAGPDLTLNGFLWLSTGRPTAADALPSFDNWVSGVYAVPLERVRTRSVVGKTIAADLFPALVVLRLRELTLDALPQAERSPDGPAPPDALLGSWELEFDVDNPALALRGPGGALSFTTLAERLFDAAAPLLPADLFERHEALAWRRHPVVPLVQVLPLTQTTEPPNVPSASRQLAPFALPTTTRDGLAFAVPAGWRLGVTIASGLPSGAASWPRLNKPDPLLPAAEWRVLPDLPLAALSLPGLQLDPSAFGAGSGLAPAMLPLQYRYDLPYADEVQALAQLPKGRRRPDEVSPLPDDPPPEPPPPLTRATYAGHWRRLSEKASLAAADAVAAFGQEDGQPVVRGLVEPFAWKVAPDVELDAYPGKLTIVDAGGGGTLVLEGGAAADDGAGQRTPGASDAALRGISGAFAPQGQEHIKLVGQADASTFVVGAGSMAAYRNPDGTFRDQRGLSRAATAQSGELLVTTVQLDRTPREGTPDVVALTSTRAAWNLELEPGHAWRLWFRDLPVRPTAPDQPLEGPSSIGEATRSDANKDTNLRAPSRSFADREQDLTDALEGPSSIGEATRSDANKDTNLRAPSRSFADREQDLTDALEGPSSIGEATRSDANKDTNLRAPSRSFADREQDLTDALGGGAFVRAQTASPAAEDVNDPEALAREYNYLNGYEWRLADSGAPEAEAPVVKLCGLEFYPLTLERLDIAAGLVRRVELVGRLQLPLSSRPTEIADLGNAVRATFTGEGGRLALTELALVSGLGEWPLALARGELGGTARVVWGGITYEPATQTAELTGAELRFELFDAEWHVPLKPGTARFAAGTTAILPEPDLPVADGPLVPVAAALTLNLAAAAAATGDGQNPPPVAHSLTVDLAVRLGRALAALDAAGRTAFTATVRFTVLAPTEAPPLVLRAALFDDIVLRGEGTGLGTLDLLVAGRALQFAWDRWQQAPAGLQILPGMPLAGDASPGAVALAFDATATGGIPRLDLRLAFVEAALQARWGAFLQTDAPVGIATPAQVYGSSAGEVALGYTAHAVEQGGALAWDEGFLLNGFLEVKSLISWPASLSFDGATATLTLPAAQPGASLHHTRQTMRVLLNQHRIPPELLALAEGQELLFDLAPGQLWQTLAVVEHQLVDVYGEPELQLGADRRWTAAQEVRLLSPGALRTFLEWLGDGALRSLDPLAGLAPLAAASEGYFTPELRAALLAELDRRAAHGPCLLVEASAPHWVRRSALGEARPTVLQYLPGGSQHAILSGPDDYTPAAPLTPDSEWLLLTTPFLGRLQPPAADGLDQAAEAAHGGPLAVDPVLALRRALAQPERPPHTPLALALTHRGDGAQITAGVALLDTAAGHTFARLDPLTLAENWFRLQAPFPEPPPARLPSVMAALPDTPARAGRSVALRRAFDPFRPFVPPADVRDFRLPGDADFRYELPPELAGAELVWRQHSLLAPSVVRAARARDGAPIAEGLQVLYTFAEGSGDRVGDSSGVGTPLNLTIREPGDVTWDTEGLIIRAPTVISSTTAARKVIDACRGTNEITLEAWIGPSTRTATSLPRIVAICNDHTNRNAELIEERQEDGGEQVRYVVRLRMTTTKTSSHPPLETPWLPRPSTTRHIVYTRDATGTARIYIDGVQLAQATIAGDFSGWRTTYKQVAGNTLDGERPWRGALRRLAFYSRALTPAEVARGYAALSEPALSAWHTTAALLASAGLLGAGAGTTGLRRYPAATLLPARLTAGLAHGGAQVSAPNPQPLSFAVSPYLGLSFRPAPAQTVRALVSAELVCVDPLTGQLRPAASRFFEGGAAAQDDALNDQAGAWARELHRQLTPESPLALLRLREIRTLPEGVQPAPETAAIVTGFRFALVRGLELRPSLARSVVRLRAAPRELRFREGQYGGSRIPSAVEPFELAPPQVVGAQPIYLTERPAPPAAQNGDEPPPAGWPWGLSALRFSVRYTKAGRGIAGPQPRDGSAAPALWWQAIQYGVQYRSALRETPLFELPPVVEGALTPGAVAPALLAAFAAKGVRLEAGSVVRVEQPGLRWAIDDEAGSAHYAIRKDSMAALRVFRRAAPAAGLPALFRAAPIRSLLPVLPTPPLPPQRPEAWAQPAEGPGTGESTAARTWQPLLPGALRYFIVGARSGVMLALRNQLIRQRDGALVSGSLPVQHRAPRPVPLPPNRPAARQVALRTWAGYFEPERNLLVSRDPLDEAFYAATATRGPLGLRLRLATPARGTIPADWDGTLAFEALTQGQALPPLTVALLAAGETFAYQPFASAPPDAPDLPSRLLTFTTQQQETIRRQLAALGAGAEVLVQVKVEPADAFRQTLTFALRLADPDATPLPLDPYTIHFEDPEYNRALATQAGLAQRLIKLIKRSAPNQFGLCTATLATDRRAYNQYSPLALRYDWDSPALAGTRLQVVFQRVTAKGVTEDLVGVGASAAGITQLLPGELLQINLVELRVSQPDGAVGNRFALQPDDKLRIKLLPGTDEAGWGAYKRPLLTPEPELLAQIEVDIVDEPVIPVPEAAYALLRSQALGGQAQVECARFAWGPSASRIELVSKDDLKAGVVRRRAVFQWRDVVRAGTLEGYAVQKITPSGATHIPLWEKGGFEGPLP